MFLPISMPRLTVARKLISGFGVASSATFVGSKAGMESAADLDAFWGAINLENTGKFAALAVKMKVKPTRHKKISILYQ